MKTSHLSTCIALSCVTLAASPVTSQTTTSVPLHFENTDVREILPLYESLTHFRIIRDNFVQGKISISAPQPVDPQVAIDMIERSFFANGFAIIQLDPETVEIVGVGRNARSSGVPAISDPKQLPEHERLVSCLFQFRRADAKAIQQLFAQYLSPPRAYTSFLLSSDAHVLWVTERTSVIRQLLVVAEKLDVPPEQQSHSER